MENISVAMFTILADPRKFVAHWYETSGKNASKSSQVSTLLLDYNSMYQAFKASNHGHAPKMIGHKMLEHALTEFLADEENKRKQEALAAIVGSAENLAPLRAWVKAVTGNESELDVAVMAHWIWQIKRKGTGQSVVHHIMPVLYGTQGSGKTMALERLLEPVRAVRADFPMSNLDNPSYYSAFEHNLVILFDELQGIDKTEMTALKHQITATQNSFRVLYTHNVVTVPMSCSFIGATNKHLYESINDTTGMRRFYELMTQTPLDWSAINSIDYLALWQGVDVNKPRGYLVDDLLKKIHEVQESSKNEEDIDTYMRERALKPIDGQVKLVTKQDLYTDYSIWAANNGIRTKLTSQWFTKKLKTRGISTREDEKAGRVFAISVASSVGGKGYVQ